MDGSVKRILLKKRSNYSAGGWRWCSTVAEQLQKEMKFIGEEGREVNHESRKIYTKITGSFVSCPAPD
jgi:hypothetical protein